MYVYMSQKRRRTAMMTSFPLKLHRTHIYMKQDNIETAKRSFLTFRFSLYIYFIVAIVVAALFSLYILFSSTCTHTCAVMFIYIHTQKRTQNHASTCFPSKNKHSQAKCTCSTRCINNHALKAPSGNESIIEKCIGKVNLILKYATWVYPRQRQLPRHLTCADLAQTCVMAIWRLARIQGRACWDGSLTRYTNMKTGRCENARACNCGRRSLPRCGATIVCTLSGRDQSGGARDQHGRRVAAVTFSLPRFRFNRFSIVFHGIVKRLLSNSRCNCGLDTNSGM